MPLRILLTGGAGFIGSHVADALAEAGHHVAVVDDLSSGRREHLNPRVRHYPVDIRSSLLEEVFDRERPHIVNHHAAQVSVTAALRNPERDASINVLGSLHVLELSRRMGVRKAVYSSTGGALYGEPESLPCPEEHPIRPLSPYGVSKYAVEQYLDIYRQAHGLDYTVLRYGNVYGPRQDPHGEAGVVAIFAQRMVRGQRCVIFGSGEQQRDFVYVDDVVQANLAVLEQGSGRAYNIGTGRGASVNAVFSSLAEALDYREQPDHQPPRPGEVDRIYLDCARAELELGWRATTSFQEGIRRTAAHYTG